MSSATLAEGTKVKIIRYDKRPEFAGAEAEIGNYSEKDNTYECWLIEDDFEGSYALCKPDEIEIVIEAKPAEEPAPAEPAPAEPTTTQDTAEQSPATVFGIGDRVRGKESGKMGTVTGVDGDGDPQVRMDGESKTLQRFGKEFELVEKACFGVGDRVRGRDSGNYGTVVSVDEDGDPKVQLDGEEEAQQRFGKEFEIIAKAKASKSRSRSNDKKKKGKKKKAKSSSSSSKSSSSSRSRKRDASSASSRHRRKGSAFGRSTLEKRADEKRRAKKIKKSAGVGANAALELMGLR